MPKLGLSLGLPTSKISISASYIPSDIPGLLAFYNFETASFSLVDSSGNGRTLDVSGNPGALSLVPGIVSNAIYFPGENDGDWARYGSEDFSIDPNSDFTVSVWLSPQDFSDYYHIIGAPFENGLLISGNGEEAIRCLLYDVENGEAYTVTGPNVVADTWNHYVFRRSGNTLLLTVNNVPSGSTSVAGVTFLGNPFFSVGAGESNFYQYLGAIDALGLWDNAISDADIAKLWNGGAGIQMPT